MPTRSPCRPPPLSSGMDGPSPLLRHEWQRDVLMCSPPPSNPNAPVEVAAPSPYPTAGIAPTPPSPPPLPVQPSAASAASSAFSASCSAASASSARFNFL
ncbi:hypothetical protein KSP39_PZI001685 [Platanthera zijinensis]|uniref:Uncharacterized protein n=1 Tax=Platanthera zijinensis TaxID=2320716 RepID=A0AAP0GED8_9ASPA